MSDPHDSAPSDPGGADEVTAPAEDGMAPIINNTGDDAADDDDAEAPTG